MKHYNISGPVNLKNIPEPTANRLQRVFGGELVLTFSKFISDRPIWRKPTDEEIIDGEYRPGSYVRTTAEDGII